MSSNALYPEPPLIASTNAVDSTGSIVIDVSKLSENERTQLRQTLIQQIQQKINEYQRLTIVWRVVYWVLGLSALFSNVAVVALSSTNIASLVSNDLEAAQVMNYVNAVVGAVALIAMTLNTYLQSYMNATYFAEAVSKYKDLQLLVWSDLGQAVSRLDKLNQKYDSSGVGSIVAIEHMQNKARSKKVSPEGYPKRHAIAMRRIS